MVFYCQHCQRGFSQQRYLTQHIQQCHVLSSKRKKRKRNYTDNSTYTLNYSDNIHFDIPKEIIITKNKNKNSKINLNDSISENTKLSDIMDNNNDNIEWYNFDNESNINDDAVATSNENENNVNKLYNSIFFPFLIELSEYLNQHNISLNIIDDLIKIFQQLPNPNENLYKLPSYKYFMSTLNKDDKVNKFLMQSIPLEHDEKIEKPLIP